MTIVQHHAHSWDVTPKEAIELQRELRTHLELEDRLTLVRTVAGVDCGFEQNGKVTRSAIAVLDFPGLQLIDQAVARVPTNFPYVPGLLSFREIPAILAAMELLKICPDVFLIDGQGYAHPRRFGIACHLGVLIDHPTIGVGKTRLCGHHRDPPAQRGAWAPLLDNDETIGAVLRSRTAISPLFVSTGHRVSLETAISIVMQCITRYRLPETTRHAHRLASY